MFRDTLERIDRLLMDSSLEAQAIEMALEDYAEASVKQQQSRARIALRAFRMEVLRFLLGGISFRGLARQVGRSDLLADFCQVRDLEGIKGISKSSLERYAKLFTEEQLRQLHQTLTEVVGNTDLAIEVGLEKPLDMGICLIDSTCLEANIHWPTDWVLLKDVAATLLQAIKLIREAGLRHRMAQGPEHYARQMNRLCIAMTHSRRRRHSGKERKKILRKMKRLLKTVGGHAQRHRDLASRHGSIGRIAGAHSWSYRSDNPICTRTLKGYCCSNLGGTQTRLARHYIGQTDPVRARHAVRHDADTVPARQRVRVLLAVKWVH